MEYLLAAVLSYVLGSSSMTYYLGKLNHVDVQRQGTGNLGASNATVLMGWGAGVLVAVHDVGKGFLAVFLAQVLFPEAEAIGAAAGVACVLGHMFPFYLKFKGGKGLASFMGVAWALDWRLALAALILLVLVTVLSDYIALGTLAVSLAVPVGLWLMTGKLSGALILLIATAVMVGKHLENLRRIRAGKEIGLRSTIKGENRVK